MMGDTIMGWWLAAAALKRKIYARDVIPTLPRLVDVVAPEKKFTGVSNSSFWGNG